MRYNHYGVLADAVATDDDTDVEPAQLGFPGPVHPETARRLLCDAHVCRLPTPVSMTVSKPVRSGPACLAREWKQEADMQTRRIGPLEVSVVGLGCNNMGRRIGAAETQAVVDAAIDAGITLFDTADVYGEGQSEQLLGRALGRRRDDVVVATKFGVPMGEHGGGASPDWVRQAVEDSLRRLGTDYIDLYQLHRPDPDVPLEETLGALGELVEAGTVRAIGHSNFSGLQIREAEAIASGADGPRFVSAQNQWSLLTADPETDVVPACRELGLGILPYFPLESGVLTGKYRRGEDPPAGSRLAGQSPERAQRFLADDKLATAEKLATWADERGHTLLELAFSWLASHDVCASVIAGATTPEQVRSNAASAGWELSGDERAEVADITGRLA